MLIFVYGILRKGSDNNFLVNNSIYLGVYKTKKKFYMYKSDNLSYALILTNNINNGIQTEIIGDVYDIDIDTFKKLGIYTDNNMYYLDKIELVDETENKNIFAHIYLFNNENENNCIIDLVEYYVNNSIDYNMRIFKLINSILEYIKLKNVKIFYLHVDDSDWADKLLNVGTNIKFPNGFANWLLKNQFHKEEENHYTKGLQPIFANLILNKTNNFTAEDNRIYVDIDDIDFNVRLKNPVKTNLL